ncbi:stage V sporulation protein B [Anoxybacillus calidus]|jgi:stage V sporulation protein B|uniref:Stage V sporulation protein B n=1 Tax=[Anoxybacillus] calidus TaxID=575178 RepID=A0A7V9Z1Q7_9BACL|nr:stage V sporulation protein B [Anoxybacillus calidus]MBA2872315.1 stage V sporulation protein B [Anoxybacillus calidus]
MSKQSMIKGTLILTVAAFITKLMGFVNSMVMARMLGSEGIGLAMMAMPFTGILISLTTLGFEVAVSKLVAEYDSKGNHLLIKKILFVSLSITSILSVMLMISCIFLSRILSSFFLTDQRAYYSFISVIPIVPIAAVSSVIKGYFRGKQNMTPIALSQIIEQMVRISFMVMLVQWLLPYGIEFAAAGAVLGGVIGEGVSIFYLISIFKRSKNEKYKLHHSFFHEISKGKDILFDLLQIGLPTTVIGLIYSISGVLQPIIITQSLALAGIDTPLATKQFGMLTGYAMPLVLLPGFITSALSVSLIPAISEAKAQNNFPLIDLRIQQAVRISLIIGVPWTIILYVFSKLLTTVIYNSPEAGVFLKILSPFFLLQYFRLPFQSVMIGLGKANIAMINNLVTTIVTLIATFILASNSEFGIYGVALAFNIGVVLGTSLHFLTIVKLTGFSINIKDFLKVIFSGFMMGWGGISAYNYLSNQNVNTLLLLISSLAFSIFIYLLFIYFLKMLDFSKI